VVSPFHYLLSWESYSPKIGDFDYFNRRLDLLNFQIQVLGSPNFMAYEIIPILGCPRKLEKG